MIPLKDKMKSDQNIYGTWCLIPSPVTINIIAKSGLDYVIIDMEHGPADFTEAQEMVMAAHAEGCSVLVRLADHSRTSILRSLDIGSDGILVSCVENVLQVREIISAAKYPPVGERGYSPYTRSGGYAFCDSYTTRANDYTVVGVIVETKKAVENLREIVSDPFLDLVYIGTYDISKDLGITGQVKHKKVRDVLDKCAKVIAMSNKVAGCLFHDEDELNYFLSMGIQFLAYKTDTNVLYSAYRSIL